MMANTADRERKNRKEDAVRRRLEEMRGHELHLLSLMDETKLDLMILALGLGEIILPEPA